MEKISDINAGRNINLHSSCGRIFLDANTAQVKALRGNLVPETWGARICKNSFIPDSTLAKIFAPFAQSIICLLYTSPSPRDP